MNAPESRRLVPPRKRVRAAKPRRTKAFLAQLRRQCRLANDADRRDNWWHAEGSFGYAVE
jgi:hypothetical protein